MAVDRQLAQHIVDMLNDMLERDKCAVAALLANRVPCNIELADHPTVQCQKQHGGYWVGLLGVLNGLCGNSAERQSGVIAAVFKEAPGEHYDTLDRFAVLDKQGRVPPGKEMSIE